MNEFTIEELKIILLDMKFYAKNKKIKCFIQATDHVELREKIQSMIDNYDKDACDHEFNRREMLIDLCGKCNSFKFVFAGINDE